MFAKYDRGNCNSSVIFQLATSDVVRLSKTIGKSPIKVLTTLNGACLTPRNAINRFSVDHRLGFTNTYPSTLHICVRGGVVGTSCSTERRQTPENNNRVRLIGIVMIVTLPRGGTRCTCVKKCKQTREFTDTKCGEKRRRPSRR